jgi:predicted transcriptional regulator
MKTSKDIIYKLSWDDLKILSAINNKKNQTIPDLFARKITSKSQLYRSVDKLIDFGLIINVNPTQYRKELAPTTRIDFKITKLN